jgi:hypothetical protein
VRRRIAAPQLLLGALAVVVVGALAAQLLIGGRDGGVLTSRLAGPRLRCQPVRAVSGALTAQEAGESFSVATSSLTVGSPVATRAATQLARARRTQCWWPPR